MRKRPDRKIRLQGSQRANTLRIALRRAQSAIEMAKESGHTGIALARVLERLMSKAENPYLRRFYEKERVKLLLQLAEQKAQKKGLKTTQPEVSSTQLPGKRNGKGRPLSRDEFDAKVTSLLREKRYEEALEELRIAGDKDWMHGLLVPPNIFSNKPEIAAKWLMTTAGMFLSSWHVLKGKDHTKALECKEIAIDCLVHAEQMYTKIGTRDALETAERNRKRIEELREEKNLDFDDILIDSEGEGEQELFGVEDPSEPKRPFERIPLGMMGERLIAEGRFEEGLSALWNGKAHNELYTVLTTNEDLRSSLRPTRRAIWLERTSDLFDEVVKRTGELEKPKDFRTNERLAIECLRIALKIFFRIKQKSRQDLSKIVALNKKIAVLKRRP